MASIHKDIIIDATPDDVWDAVRDFGALHTRLAPGFVTDTKLDGDARIVTFANGTVARELLVDCDDARRRLVYAIVSERIKQHSASAQVFAEGDGRSRWSGSSTCCRTRSRPTWMRRWIRRRWPCRRRWDAAPHDVARFSKRSARTAPPPTAPARWISTAASSAPGISMSGNFPTTAANAAAPANGISAGRWKAARSRMSGSCRRAAKLRHGDAAAKINSYGTTLRVYDPDIDAWRIQWTDPVTRNFLQMIGRAEGRDIVQLGTRPDGQLARWSFRDITRRLVPLARRSSRPTTARTWRVNHRVHRPPQAP